MNSLRSERAVSRPASADDWRERLLPEGLEIISRQGEEKGLVPAIQALYGQQTRNWPLLRERAESLKNVRLRTVQVDGRRISLQFNPARIANALAPAAAAEIAARPCPLCPHNMPPEQKALRFAGQWYVLCNLLPIFRLHLVVTHRDQTPQTIRGRLRDMLRFTGLTGLISLYNGPHSGASIPDHLHFQAAPPGGLPLERQLPSGWEDFTGILADPRLPQRIFLGADSLTGVEALFDRIIVLLNSAASRPENAEPELNLAIIRRGRDRAPLVVVHPRARHRPACFYRQGVEQCLVSPGSADMAGLVIVPRREDFDKLDGRQMRTIYREVCLSAEAFRRLAGRLAEAY